MGANKKRPLKMMKKYSEVEKAFRDQDPNDRPNFYGAAQKADVDRRMCKRLWTLGWPQYDWAPPMKDLFANEDVLKERALRAERLAQTTEDFKRAQDLMRQAALHAEKAKTEELQGVEVGRQMAMYLAGAVMPPLLKGALFLAKEIEASLTGNTLSINQKANLLRTAAYIVKQGNDAIHTALENERLRVGDPQKIVQLNVAPITAEEAAEELQEIVSQLTFDDEPAEQVHKSNSNGTTH